MRPAKGRFRDFLTRAAWAVAICACGCVLSVFADDITTIAPGSKWMELTNGCVYTVSGSPTITEMTDSTKNAAPASVSPAKTLFASTFSRMCRSLAARREAMFSE